MIRQLYYWWTGRERDCWCLGCGMIDASIDMPVLLVLGLLLFG